MPQHDGLMHAGNRCGRRWRARLVLVSACMTIAAGSASALIRDVGVQEVDEALRFVRTSTTAERARFHREYRVVVDHAPVDYLEVVTPFRAIVLAGSARAAAGDRSFSQRAALDLLAEIDGTVAVYAELTFHPLNTFIGVPSYTMRLQDRNTGASLPAGTMTRLSRWTPRGEALPEVPLPAMRGAPPNARLIGATIVAAFAVEALSPRAEHDVIMELDGAEVARRAVPLIPLR